MAESTSTSAIIVAAGIGRRMGTPSPKQFLILAGKPLLAYSIESILKIDDLRELIVVVADQIKTPELKACLPPSTIPIKIVEGGKRRQDSVFNGLQALDPLTQIVIVHDGVRPFFQAELVRQAIGLCTNYDGAILASPAVDTMKEVSANRILKTLDRYKIWHGQTPQVFQRSVLEKAYANARTKDITATDDSMLVELIGGRVAVVESSAENLKITCQNDLKIAKSILENRKL
ncbi:MAG: 2-C-methyl-D-erythritol 4-phosphate cytidylyltransferase [Candidatus Marinimicrobia bacterium]|nr:2-C-methyl-D-erythritol 4-phosphate cytidylyltransferase [Candidatus Neomarinimicrobiota bacterium]MDD5539478.1 2-C-methyl-D-erythritol 4-phosphate cytidylyltransferase [Candidatus Neomarinimicrobiota bacterium]